MFLQRVFGRLKRHGRFGDPEVRKVMRQARFLALFFLLISVVGSPIFASGASPYFVVLPQGADIMDFTTRLEKLGAVVRLQMPPNVLTFDADNSFNVQDAGPVVRIYRNVIPLSELAPYGTLAEAAGIQWNRDMVANASKQGFHTASSMRTLAAQSSLPSPDNLTAVLDGNRVHAAWNAIPGAASYAVQLAKTPTFSDKIENAVMGAEADLPRLETNGEPLYVRVRAIDGDLAGTWTQAVMLTAPAFTAGTSAAAPALSSPLDGASSDGFYVMLEWTATPNTPYRVQVSELSSFASPMIDQFTTEGGLPVAPVSLKIGKTYFWRTRQWSADGSAWSAVRRFTVTEPSHIDNDAMINPEAPR
jgi:hypothetical protein